MEPQLSTKVYIGGLGRAVDKRELNYALETCGPLRAPLWIAKNPPGFAFAEYIRHEDALAAVRELDGTKISGKRVRVELSSGESRWVKWNLIPPTKLINQWRDRPKTLSLQEIQSLAKSYDSLDDYSERSRRSTYRRNSDRSSDDNHRGRRRSRSRSRSASRSRSNSIRQSRSSWRPRDRSRSRQNSSRTGISLSKSPNSRKRRKSRSKSSSRKLPRQYETGNNISEHFGCGSMSKEGASKSDRNKTELENRINSGSAKTLNLNLSRNRPKNRSRSRSATRNRPKQQNGPNSAVVRVDRQVSSSSAADATNDKRKAVETKDNEKPIKDNDKNSVNVAVNNAAGNKQAGTGGKKRCDCRWHRRRRHRSDSSSSDSSVDSSYCSASTHSH